MVLGACAAFAFSSGSFGAPTVTLTTTVYRSTTGQAFTVDVPTTTTDTVSSLATSTSTITRTSTFTQTSLITYSETNSQTDTQSTDSTSTAQSSTQTSTTTTSTSTATTENTFQVRVGYTINDDACFSFQGDQCTWSGALSWPTSACNYYYACQTLQVSPQTGSVSYPISLGQCGISIQWSLTMTSPANESQLSVSVMNAAGALLYQTSTSSGSSSLVGSFAPC